MWLRQTSQGMRNREKGENWINVLRKREGRGKMWTLWFPISVQARQAEASLSSIPCSTDSGTGLFGQWYSWTGRATWWEGRGIITDNGRMYGKGMPLVGVPKKLKEDNRDGWCYKGEVIDRTQIQWKSLILLLLKCLDFLEAEEGNWFHCQADYPIETMFVY